MIFIPNLIRVEYPFLKCRFPSLVRASIVVARATISAKPRATKCEEDKHSGNFFNLLAGASTSFVRASLRSETKNDQLQGS